MAFTIPPAVRFRRHEHDGPHLCFVLSGGFLERERKSWVDVGPGSFRVSSAARHDIDFGSGGARCLVLEGDEDWSALSRPRFMPPDPWLLRIAGRFAAVLDGPAAVRGTLADALTTELRAQVRRRLAGLGGAPPQWLQQALGLVSDMPRGTAISEIASRVGVHRVHLARAFHNHYGVSVSEYARIIRVSRAQRLLCGSSLPLSQVAAEAGFADQAHMTRALRRAAGVTPGALRRATLHRFNTSHHAAP